MTAVPPGPVIETAAPYDDERGRLPAFIGYGLLLVSLFTGGLSGFVAAIIAYDRKGQSGPVASSHFAFQLKIFWICFAMTVAAAALWIGGLFSMLTSLPPPALRHGAPDTQLIGIASAMTWPADIETWSYGFDWRDARLSPGAQLQMALGSASMLVGVLFSWIGPIFGLARLASGRPIGHSRRRSVESEPPP